MISFIIKYWLEFLFGILVGLLGLLWEKVRIHCKDIASMKKGVKILLKNEITNCYDQVITKNSITLFEKEVLIELYTQYKNLGGNGLVENIVEKINTIPLKNGGD